MSEKNFVRPIMSSAVKSVIEREKKALAAEKKIDDNRNLQIDSQKSKDFSKENNQNNNRRLLCKQNRQQSRRLPSDDAGEKITLRGSGVLISPSRYLRRKVSGIIHKVRVSFRIDAPTKELLRSLATNDGVSLCEILNRAIWCYLTVVSKLSK